MTSEAPCWIYGLEFQCRALCSIQYDANGNNDESDGRSNEDVDNDEDGDRIAFLVGTQGLKNVNEVHEVELDEKTQKLSKSVYRHDEGEIWDLQPFPNDGSKFVSLHSCLEDNQCRVGGTLWQKKGRSSDERETQRGTRSLSKVCSISTPESEKSGSINDTLQSLRFKPGCSKELITLQGNRIHLHDLEVASDSTKVVASGELEGKGQTMLTTGTWNPHQNCQQFASVNEACVKAWDVRTMKMAWEFENPSLQVIRDVDFNPNKQYHLATCGDDGLVRFWDTRKPKEALLTREDHSHWIWSVKYNAFHDQLILTSGSDCRVVLLSLASISSEPVATFDEEEASSNAIEDGIVAKYEDHEESVYTAKWAAADPWTFASLSYDGRLMIHQVPREVKFKILHLM